MEKVLISLSVPAISSNNDVYIPDFLPVYEVIQLLITGIKELSNYRYISSGNEVLCSQEKNSVLSYSKSLKQCGVVNGEHLILL